jgi:urea transport system permease protein
MRLRAFALDIRRHLLNIGLCRAFRQPVRVLLLMALGLAIIFGQMGVINMAHGEFMTIGAYTTYLLLAPDSTMRRTAAVLLSAGHRAAFAVAYAAGWLVEWADQPPLQASARYAAGHLGRALAMQQTFRSIFGAKEVSATCRTG